MSNGLQVVRLRQVVSELRNLDNLLSERGHHVGFLRAAATNFDARDSLLLANELESETGPNRSRA